MRFLIVAAGSALSVALASSAARAQVSQERWIGSADLRAALPLWNPAAEAGLALGFGLHRSLSSHALLGPRFDAVVLAGGTSEDHSEKHTTLLMASAALRWRPWADPRQLARGTGAHIALAGGAAAVRLDHDWYSFPVAQLGFSYLIDDGQSMGIGPSVRYFEGFVGKNNLRLLTLGIEITFLDQRGLGPPPPPEPRARPAPEEPDRHRRRRERFR